MTISFETCPNCGKRTETELYTKAEFDEAVASLKAEIERKDEAISRALIIDAKDSYSMHPEAVKVLIEAVEIPEEDGE